MGLSWYGKTVLFRGPLETSRNVVVKGKFAQLPSPFVVLG